MAESLVIACAVAMAAASPYIVLRIYICMTLYNCILYNVCSDIAMPRVRRPSARPSACLAPQMLRCDEFDVNNVTYLLRGKGPASPPPPPRLLPSPGAWARFNRKNLLLPNASHLSSHILSYLSWFIRSDLQCGLLFLQC